MRSIEHDSEGLSRHYLQVSPILFDHIPMTRPPVSLYHLDHSLGQVRLLHRAEERIPKPKREEIACCCKGGRLFLCRTDYGALATIISKNLGALLDEPFLPTDDIAGFFYAAFRARIADFFCQPVVPRLDPILADIDVLCEYLWAFPERASSLLAPLDGDCSRASHAARTCFVGAGIVVGLARGRQEKTFMRNLLAGLLLHDVGMGSVPDFITKKPAKLLYKERQRVEMHVESGLSTLDRLQFKPVEVSQCVAEHHERFGGGGYPKGLRGEQISLAGRICAVADAFSAMISERPYAPRRTPRAALAALGADARSFDPALVKELALLLFVRE